MQIDVNAVYDMRQIAHVQMERHRAAMLQAEYEVIMRAHNSNVHTMQHRSEVAQEVSCAQGIVAPLVTGQYGQGLVTPQTPQFHNHQTLDGIVDAKPSEEDIAFVEGVWKDDAKEQLAIQYIILPNFYSKDGLQKVKYLYNRAKMMMTEISDESDEVYNFCSNVIYATDDLLNNCVTIQRGPLPSNVVFVTSIISWLMR